MIFYRKAGGLWGGRKNSIARARERMFLPSLHWRYHKMIITTTIWWVHNWLNIKNCSERSLGSPCGWNDVLGWESSRGVFSGVGQNCWMKRRNERSERARWGARERDGSCCWEWMPERWMKRGKNKSKFICCAAKFAVLRLLVMATKSWHSIALSEHENHSHTHTWRKFSLFFRLVIKINFFPPCSPQNLIEN